MCKVKKWLLSMFGGVVGASSRLFFFFIAFNPSKIISEQL